MAIPVIFLCSCSESVQPPNIILCMGDDHGWDETGYNGHPYLHTPVLDEMAGAGLRLDRFYSAHPSCSPTRGSVMTGRHPNRYGTFSPNWSIRPEEISIAQILGRAGYACGHFGKWHLGPVKEGSPTNPGAMGFDEWLSHDNFFELDPYFSRNGGPPELYPGESSEILVEEAIRFMSKAGSKGQPFFVVLWFGSPHEPYSGLEEDLALYDDLPGIYNDRTFRLTSNETGLRVERPLGEVLQERFAEITAMDRSMGRLRQWLGAEELRQNTLLWYCGDNGTPGDGIVTSPFRGQKGNMYEGGIRVPGIIEWPGRITSPRVSEVNTVTSDMLPTICELVGQPLPDRPLDGISLKPLIDGRMTERPGPVCFWQYSIPEERKPVPYIEPEWQEGTTPLVKQMNGLYTRNFRNFHLDRITEQDYEGSRVILDKQFKLVVGPGKDPVIELFQIREDPAEEHDISEANADIVRAMQGQLEDWQTSVLRSLKGEDYE
jgi:arylsulfatase A-like enzyme